MRSLLVFLFLTFSFISISQDEFMVWTEIGAKGKIVKKLGWKADINTRFIPGVQTFFPQVGINYKVTKWFKPSIEYRFIIDKNKYGNFKASNRLNFNLAFKHDIKRFYGSMRVRYQYGFDRVNSEDYDGDFDQAFRFKPAVEYKIKKSRFIPGVSAELFLNPAYGPNRGFTKVRFAAGTIIELKGPQEVSIKYQLDKKLRNYSAGMRHVISLGYNYKF